MFGLSKRWETVAFLVSGITISYCLRVNISVAAQDMRDDLGWSETDKGYVLSSFYWGYAFGQVPSSLLAGRVGAKWTFAFSILIPAILSLVMPWACRQSLTAALILRCFLGLSASATFPSCFHFYPPWIPVAEKTVMIATVGSGMYLGEIVGFSMSGYLVSHDLESGGIKYGGWPSVFYLFGLIGIAWFPFFVASVYSTPDEHPTISAEELALIKKDNEYFGPMNNQTADSKAPSAFEPLLPPPSAPYSDAFPRTLTSTDAVYPERTRTSSSFSLENYIVHSSERYPLVPGASDTLVPMSREEMKKRIPWVAFFTQPASIALLTTSWTFGWIGFMILSELPSYLTDELGYDLESAGFLSIAPYAANYVSVLLFGAFFKHLQSEHGWTTRAVRQASMIFAFIGSSGALVICGFLSQPEVAYSFMIMALFFFGATQAGIACAYLDVSPNYSSTLNAVGNCVGAIAGFVSPLVVAACTTTWPGEYGWRAVFFITAGMCGISLVIWALFQTSDIVPALNNPRPKKIF